MPIAVAQLANLAKVLGTERFFCGQKPMYCDFGVSAAPAATSAPAVCHTRDAPLDRTRQLRLAMQVYHAFDIARLLEPRCLDTFPNITAFMVEVEFLPGVKEYLAARPDAVDLGVDPKLVPKAGKLH